MAASSQVVSTPATVLPAIVTTSASSAETNAIDLPVDTLPGVPAIGTPATQTNVVGSATSETPEDPALSGKRYMRPGKMQPGPSVTAR